MPAVRKDFTLFNLIKTKGCISITKCSLVYLHHQFVKLEKLLLDTSLFFLDLGGSYIV